MCTQDFLKKKEKEKATYLTLEPVNSKDTNDNTITPLRQAAMTNTARVNVIYCHAAVTLTWDKTQHLLREKGEKQTVKLIDELIKPCWVLPLLWVCCVA